MLSRIYTRVGDDGTTALGDGSRTAKTDPRLAAYADVDEANCALGVAVTIEFLGPLDVAVAGSRHLRDIGWVVLAATGVVLLTQGGPGHQYRAQRG